MLPESRTGPSSPKRQPAPSPTNMRTLPLGPVFSHQPLNKPCVDQIVLLSGSADGRTISSIEKAVGVQAAAPGTSAYWLEPLKVTAVSGSATSKPVTPRWGLP